MSEPITPEELPRWVPGKLVSDSVGLGWDGIRMRGYRYAASDVPVPALRDYTIVVYRDGVTPMHRRCDGAWHSETCTPGTASLLTRAARSHWRWSQPIEVAHLYLSPAAIVEVAAEVFDRDIDDIELRDVLKAEDPVLSQFAEALTRELQDGGVGGPIYIDALRTQACVHILRNYANVHFRAPVARGGLRHAQRKLVERYIEDNLHRNIGLAELARIAQLSSFHFARSFRSEFDCPPHAYVIRRRLAHAKRQLALTAIPLKCVAANSGFADQSHMTRLFRRMLGCTPAAYRDAAGGGARPGVVVALPCKR